MSDMRVKNQKTAFTLVELSIVLIIIGLIVTGIVAGGSLVEVAKVSGAKSITKTSPVNAMEDLALWIETTTDESFNDQVPSDGDAVGTIDDINPQVSTGVGNATQSTGANQPAFKTNIQNGLPMLYFDGGDYLETAIKYEPSNPMTVFVVAKFEDASSEIPQAMLGKVASVRLFYSTTNTLNSDVSSGVPNLLDSTSNAAIYTMRHTGVGNAMTYYVGSTTQSVGLVSETGTTGAWIIGADGDLSSNFTGHIGEIIMFERALSDADVTKIQNYLSTKWGIPL